VTRGDHYEQAPPGAGRPALDGLAVVWHPDCLLHEPDGEVWLGVWETGTEIPRRAEVLRDALVGAGGVLTPSTAHPDSALTAVHETALIEHLASVWSDWVAAGYPADHDRPRVVPYLFPTPGLLGPLPMRSPLGLHGRLGRFCYDTMTLIGPGTWRAARAAADVALTAVDLVVGGRPLSYSLCRPPGHHVGPAAYGGSCYLNNAAIAAQALRKRGAERVAILDIDAHHGNGTQAIFYDRDDVYVGSVHVDPAAGWFPHYAGYPEERGGGAGAGANRNLPLAPGSGDEVWLAAVDQLCDEARARGTDALVVSLGLDAFEDDPESPLRVTVEGYRRAGEMIGGLAPIVVVQEGGYNLAALGALAVATLEGLRAGSR
jgi:acetoin utilization deacetylase AcuC-like enzyme